MEFRIFNIRLSNWVKYILVVYYAYSYHNFNELNLIF